MKSRVFSACAIMTATLTLTLGNLTTASACTDFAVKSKDGSVIAARSMEWGAELNSRIAIHSRGEDKISKTPSGADGMHWKTTYGFLDADALGLEVVVDGVNEKGLSFGMLWFPDYIQYASMKPGSESSAINVTDLGHWLLGTCATVEEAKRALANATVFATDIPSFGGAPNVHVALHDANGNNAVIEFIGGKQLIMDNPGSVLTNAPPLDWQLINLKNYFHIDANNPQPLQVVGTVLGSPGQGGGFLGIPGDWTPPSRFVRTSAMLHFAKQTADRGGAINLAAHILNAVDIPRGDIREQSGGHEYTDYTQWILIKDLSGKALYFRSYDNLTLRKLDMTKLDFSAGKTPRFVPIAGGSPSQDISAE